MKQKNSFLFGTLLTLSFATILALWFPGFIQNLTDFTREVKTVSGESGKTLKQQWTGAQNTMKALMPKPADDEKPKLPIKEDASETFKKKVEGVLSQEEQGSESKKNCTRQGGIYREDSEICVFSDGSECDAEMFLYSKCHKGQYAVAKDGIPQKPDLIVSQARMFHCTKDMVEADKESADHYCADGTMIFNRGRVSSKKTVVRIGEQARSVPALEKGASYAVDGKMTLVKKEFPLMNITVDPFNEIPEIIEENNTKLFPNESL